MITDKLVCKVFAGGARVVASWQGYTLFVGSRRVSVFGVGAVGSNYQRGVQELINDGVLSSAEAVPAPDPDSPVDPADRAIHLQRVASLRG